MNKDTPLKVGTQVACIPPHIRQDYPTHLLTYPVSPREAKDAGLDQLRIVLKQWAAKCRFGELVETEAK